ncbi:mechanosensitive ion channel family protein [Erysipelothrix sp. HDW6B]|uniref:mechanosensitive ion channel family protein n=1 Tax=Erysipelothrix TaxID=1647 RepID=UPI00135A050D|nr:MULTISPECIES: mechanosensitive ion channel family protein [Erysipelothrix]QIK85659.1 mechanosensitive ion channel family protein [Erysipelothrix sp. HDW6B]
MSPEFKTEVDNVTSLWGYISSPFAQRVIATAILFFGVWVINRAIESAIDRIANERRIDINKRTIYQLIAKIIRYILYVIAFTFMLEIFNISIAPLLAIGSAVGVAVGLGAQEVVRDTISGFLILTENQYVIGDVVKIEDSVGEVVEVTLLSTILRNGLTGEVITIPNGEIKVIVNYSKEYMNAYVDIPMPYEMSTDSIISTLQDIVAPMNYEGALTPVEVIGIVDFAQSAIKVRVSVKTEAGKNYEIERRMRKDIKNALDEKGIAMPYNTQTVHLKQ